jgi:negative regulator of sigma E activity
MQQLTNGRSMSRVKLVAIICTLAASLTLASASSGGNSEEASSYVSDALAAQSTVSYTGTVEVVRIGSEGSQATVYRVEHRAPDLTKRTYLSPRRLEGDELLFRGDQTYAVDVSRHRIIQAQNQALDDSFALNDNYRLLRSNYRPVEQSADPIDGRRVETIQLINKYTRRAMMVIRVDQGTKLVLDKQQFDADGSLIEETRFESVAYAQPPVSDFAIPKSFATVKGADLGKPSVQLDRVEKQAGFPTRDPKFLPEGFAPVEGNVVEIKGVRTLHLLYSDGIRNISLFEHTGPAFADLSELHPKPVTIDGRDGQYAAAGSMTLLTWQDGDLHCALVGDLNLDELEHIAASISP